MINFYAYTPEGRVVMTGNCPDGQLEIQQCPGATIAEGVAVIGAHYVADGELVLMPPKPGNYYEFDYGSRQWVLDTSLAEFDVRSKRNSLLQESDWTDTASAPARLGEAVYQSWQSYRQALRDVTSQPGFPLEVVWPTPPTT